VSQKKIKVYLSETSKDVYFQRTFLFNVLKKAELDVICIDEIENTQIDKLRAKVQQGLAQSDCSIHIIESEYVNIESTQNSISELQLIEAEQYSKNFKKEFRIFIWQPKNNFENKILENKQELFITSIRNSILQNITISNQESAIGFVEEINAIMDSQSKTKQEGKNTEIFFIYNELDQCLAKEIADLLDDILQVEKLMMVQSLERDYSNFIIDQAKHSKLIVVFFKWSSNWAVPFVQQLWRILGGASSNIQIITISDNLNQEQFQNSFSMPKVSSLFVSEELIPLEIKVQFDRIFNL